MTARLQAADPAGLATRPRPLDLVYVGNQYDRDEAFDTYFAPAARAFRNLVAGKWTHTEQWPQVTFADRVPFDKVKYLYGRSLTTVLLLPKRYEYVGQMTQRIFEAVLAGCLPIAPAHIRHVDQFVPPQLIVNDGADTIRVIHWLRTIAGSAEHVELLTACLAHLEIFQLSRQLEALQAILAEVVTRNRRLAGGRR